MSTVVQLLASFFLFDCTASNLSSFVNFYQNPKHMTAPLYGIDEKSSGYNLIVCSHRIAW